MSGDDDVDASDKILEPDDPYQLTTMAYPVEDGQSSDREMARCFIEEYALMGWSRDRIRRLFGSPFFAGTHGILERRGSDFIEALLAETFEAPDAETEEPR
ncbi:MAG TPA: hypothetical protein VFQ40_08985 [Actinomycetota bacterium]|nr:hypothetical protein [Actinomycetota bacterium]